jgi:hypothetical protein
MTIKQQRKELPAKTNKKAPIGGPLKESLQTIKQPI